MNVESLYIRPFCFANEQVVSIKKSDSYTFAIILSPVGAYYSEPVSVFASEEFVRAFPGGTGFAKAAFTVCDPIVIATASLNPVFFLTKSDVFKNNS